MSISITTPLRCSLVLLMSALLVSGCSSSGDANSTDATLADSQPAAENSVAAMDDTNSGDESVAAIDDTNGGDESVAAINDTNGGDEDAAALDDTNSGDDHSTTTPQADDDSLIVSGPPEQSLTDTTPATDTLLAIQPQELSIEVYSSTTAELFWLPAGHYRPVVERNEIRRNGVLIDTVQGEFLGSYFDDTRMPGTVYTYEVTAISSAGIASATVSDTGFSSSLANTSTVLPVTDLPEATQIKLDTAFDIINGVAVEQVMATIGKLADRDNRGALGIELVEVVSEAGSNPVDSYSCPNGGELHDTRRNGDTDQRFSTRLDAIDCAIGPIVFSAIVYEITTRVEADGFQPTRISARDIELVDSRELSTTTSESMFLNFALSIEQDYSIWNAIGLSVDRDLGSYSVSISGSGNDLVNVLPDGRVGLTVRSSVSDESFAATESVTTLGPMVFANGHDNASPSEGRVLVESTTDSLLIDALSDSPDTFNLTVTSDSSTTTYTVPFSDTRQFEVPLIDGVDVGF